MKTILKLIVPFVLIVNFSLFAQDIKCTDFKTGKFGYSEPKFKSNVVIRNEFTQIETDPKSGVIIESSIKWLSECKYELIYTKISEELYSEIIGQKIIITILKIVGNTAFCKSEGEGFSRDLEIIKTE